MIDMLFCSNLNEELGLDEKVTVCYEPGMTSRSIFEELGIKETSIGMIIKDGLSIMPTEGLKDGDCLEIYPCLIGG